MSLDNLKDGLAKIYDDAGIRLWQYWNDDTINQDGVVVLRIDELKRTHNTLRDYEIDITILGMTIRDNDTDNARFDDLFAEVNAVASGLTASTLRYQSGEKVIGLVHNGETMKQDEGANTFEIAKTIYVCDLEI